MRIIPQRGHRRNARQQMRVLNLFQLFLPVRARENADVPSHADIPARLKVKRGIAGIGDFRDAHNAGGFQRMENQIGRRTSLRDIITTNHGLHEILIPFHQLQD